MAEEEKKDGESEKKGSKTLVIVLSVVIFLLIVGGVGAFFALSGGSSSEEGDDGEESDEELAALPEDLPGAILPLETFIVNLQVKGSFLKTTIQLEFIEPELPPTIETDVPKIRDGIIRSLSARLASEILTLEGKEELREEVKDVVNDVLGAEEVVQVYFTEFIVQ